TLSTDPACSTSCTTRRSIDPSFYLKRPSTPCPTLFPYTTLFRSEPVRMARWDERSLLVKQRPGVAHVVRELSFVCEYEDDRADRDRVPREREVIFGHHDLDHGWSSCGACGASGSCSGRPR